MNEKEVFNLDTKQIEALPQEESAKKETLPSLEKVQSVESVEGEQVACEKLEKLMQEDFKDFAVRFMNVGEYREIMENQSLGVREAFIFGQAGHWQPSFKEYVEHAKKRQRGWADVAWEQADWEHSIIDMNVYNILLEELKKYHEQAKKQRVENIRSAILKQFREFAEELIKDIQAIHHRLEGKQNFLHEKQSLQKKLSGKLPQETIEEIFEKGGTLKSEYDVKEFITSLALPIKEKLKGDITYVLEWQLRRKNDVLENNIDEGTLQILNEFLEDPDYLEKDKNNLRKVMNAISYAPKQFRRDSRQYNIALVLDVSSAAIGGRAWNPEWGYIGDAKDWKGESTYEKGNAILAAVATMPNKELWQDMSKLSAHAGSMAHPIFDRNGIVRWPKMQKAQAEEEIFDLDKKRFVAKESLSKS